MAHALALGALQGPTELLPISSSGHTTLVPWLLGWGHEELDPQLRKTFEVALHAGGGLALLWVLRAEIRELLLLQRARALGFGALGLVPSTVVGYLLERPIEARLGRPTSVAFGLIGGAAAMACADRAPQLRKWRSASLADALWLGVAQACALVPGVSRAGATLAAGRARRFARADAHHLSRQMTLPVTVAAVARKSMRLRADGLPAAMRAPFCAGAAASLVSTLASAPLLRLADGGRSLAPLSAYRIALAAVVLRRLRAERSTHVRSAASSTMGW